MGYNGNIIAPVNVKSFIKEHNRTLEAKRDISKWFLEERLTIDFGDYVGRPSALITLQNEYLPRFLENGWTIESVGMTSESGDWSTKRDQDVNSGSVTNSHEDGVSHTSSLSSTSGSSVSNSSSTNIENSNSTDNDRSVTVTGGSDKSSSNSTNRTASNSSSTSSDSSSSTVTDEFQTSGSNKTSDTGASEKSVETASGAAYWATVQRITLKRRRMQPELVLQDMIDSYVVQLNTGVTNEDARFNELVTLYGVMLNRNETEGNAIVNRALDVVGLFNDLRASVQTTWESAHNTAVGLKKAADESAANEIRHEFEALISKTRSQMIGQGTYNGTVWPTVEAGLRRQMAEAVSEARTKGLSEASSQITAVLNAKGDVMAQLVNAKNAIAAAIDNRRITVIELRNTVMQAMLNFIGSREDVYPQIQEISNLASQIGFTVGAAGNVL